MNNKIEDVMICPHCNSNNCYEFNADEIDFSSDNSHYFTDCHCNNCRKDFRLCFKFEYNIPEWWFR